MVFQSIHWIVTAAQDQLQVSSSATSWPRFFSELEECPGLLWFQAGSMAPINSEAVVGLEGGLGWRNPWHVWWVLVRNESLISYIWLVLWKDIDVFLFFFIGLGIMNNHPKRRSHIFQRGWFPTKQRSLDWGNKKPATRLILHEDPIPHQLVTKKMRYFYFYSLHNMWHFSHTSESRFHSFFCG